jgi:predicted transcriptional regulator
MKADQLAKILERVEHWPAHARDELAAVAHDIEAGMQGQVYQPTPEELEGIDRGLSDASQGRYATEEEVEAAFAKFRRR